MRKEEPASPNIYDHGLTIREHLASLAMQGWLGSFGESVHQLVDLDHKRIAEGAVMMADALIKELSRDA